MRELISHLRHWVFKALAGVLSLICLLSMSCALFVRADDSRCIRLHESNRTYSEAGQPAILERTRSWITVEMSEYKFSTCEWIDQNSFVKAKYELRLSTGWKTSYAATKSMLHCIGLPANHWGEVLSATFIFPSYRLNLQIWIIQPFFSFPQLVDRLFDRKGTTYWFWSRISVHISHGSGILQFVLPFAHRVN